MAKGRGRRGGSALMAAGSVGPTSMIRSKAYTGKGKRGAGWWDDLTGWVKKNKLVKADVIILFFQFCGIPNPTD